MRPKDELGRRGEDLAAEHLTGAGLTLVERNWRCPAGEIDIVAVDSGTLVLVEVKTRTSTAYGHPFEAITPGKLRRLHLLAGSWFEVREAGRRRPFRVDVVGIIWPPLGDPNVQHLRAVS